MKNLLFIAILTFVLAGFSNAQKTPDAFEKLAKLRTQIEKLLRDGHQAQALKVVEGINEKEALEQPEFYNIKALVYLSQNDFAKADENYQKAFDLAVTSVEIDMLNCNSLMAQTIDADVLLMPELTLWKYESIIKINNRRQDDYEKRSLLKNLEPLNLKGTEELPKLKEDMMFCSAKSLLKGKSATLITTPTETALENLNIVIRLNPTRTDAYLERAKAYRKLGKNDLAEADEKKAQELEK